jgi:hypothetical protein
MKIFAGRESRGSDDSNETSIHRWAAYSTQGLCAYYGLLEDPNFSPKDAARIHILPGCIEYHERQYSVVEDLRVNHDSDSPLWSSCVTMPSDQVDFIVQETAHSDKIAGAYRMTRIQSSTPHTRKSISPYPLYFPVYEAVECVRTLLQIRCPGKNCSNSVVFKMRDDEFAPSRKSNLTSWSLLSDISASIGGQRPDEKPILSEVPAPGPQRPLLLDDPRTTSLSLLFSNFFPIESESEDDQEKALIDQYELEFHNFPVFSGIGSERRCSTPTTFARLYAEIVHAKRTRCKNENEIALLEEFDDCAICLIKVALNHMIVFRPSPRYGNITGTLIRHLANGEQQSRAGFALKRIRG